MSSDKRSSSSLACNISPTLPRWLKASLIIFSISLSFFITLLPPALAALPPEGPLAQTTSDYLARWSFDDSADPGAETTANFPLTLSSTTWTSQTVLGDGGLAFNGTTSYVSATTTSTLRILGDVTLSTWVYFNTLPSSDLFLINHLKKGEAEADNILYALTVRSNGKVRSFHEYSNGSNETLDFNHTTLTTNQWHHLAIIRDTTAKQVDLYIDGEFIETLSYSNNPTGGSNGQLALGRNTGQNDPQAVLDGRMDDARIYNRTLSSAEVDALYTERDYVARWTFDNPDNLGQANLLTHNGTLSYTVSYTANATLGGAAQFGAGHIDVPDHRDLDGTQKMSFSFWLYRTQLITDNSGQSLISRRENWNSGSSKYAYAFQFKGANNHLIMDFDTFDIDDRITSTATFTANRWYHVAVVFDGTQTQTQRVKLYVDGDLDGTYAESSDTIPNASLPLTFGRAYANPSQPTNGRFNGLLDDVRLYRKVLSAAEVEALYDESQCNFNAGLDHLFLNGDASLLSSSHLQLTPEGNFKNGAAFYKSPCSVENGFTTTFAFQINESGPKPADGLTFIIQNDAAGSNAIGDFATYGGGGLGYAGLKNTVAVEFDTWEWVSGAAVFTSQISIQTNGNGTVSKHNSHSLGIAYPVFDIYDGRIYTTTITYNPGTLKINITDPNTPTNNFSFSVPLTLTNISGDNILQPTGNAFVGFSAATGGDASQHKILTWSFDEMVLPVLNPPPLDQSVPYDVATASQFLYTGDDRVQFGVLTGTIEATRTAVIRGKVIDRDGNALPGATITIKDHPEFGYTLSRIDGQFDMAVNGGETIVVEYSKAGYLPAQRRLDVPWRVFADRLPDVALIELDPMATTISISSTVGQVASSTLQTDDDGSRRASLYFPPGLTATMVFSDGSTSPLTDTVTFRATEFTVGDTGPEAMPGEIPLGVGYNYATELSFDEAIEAGAVQVTFNITPYMYVDNFMDIPLGEIVPNGYYDYQNATWEANNNGVVLKILSTTVEADSVERAVLDLTGSGVATPTILATWGITDTEREHLATLYNSGAFVDGEVWRAPTPHFSPLDHNWITRAECPETGGCPSPDNPEPDLPNNEDSCPKPRDCDETQNSRLSPFARSASQDQNLGFTSLHYNSNYARNNLIQIPINVNQNVNSLVQKTHVKAAIPKLGLDFSIEVPTSTQVVTLTFDLDQLPYDRKLGVGDIYDVKVQIGWQYPVVLRNNRTSGASSGGGGGGTGAAFATPLLNATFFNINGRLGAIRWQRYTIPYELINAASFGLGGWSIGINHLYLPDAQTLILGTGDQRAAYDPNFVVETVAGNGKHYESSKPNKGDGGPATEANLNTPYGVTVGPNGNIYIADKANSRIRMVDSSGIITTVVGGGSTTVDETPRDPLDVSISSVYDVAFAPNGDMYIASVGKNQVYRVDAKTNKITNFAGSGTKAYSGDGGLATEADLYWPHALEFGMDGNLYIAIRNVIKRVDLSTGIILTIAGDSTGSACSYTGFNCNNGAAPIDAKLRNMGQSNSTYVGDIAFDNNGDMYIAEHELACVRKIDMTTNIITTVVGICGSGQHNSDLGPTPLQTKLYGPSGLTFDDDNNMYIAEDYNNRIIKVTPAGDVSLVVGNKSTINCGGGYCSYVGDYNGDDLPAGKTYIYRPYRMDFSADGKTLYFTDSYNNPSNDKNNRVRAVAPPLPGFGLGDITLPSDDGNQFYVFNSQGRHLRTIDAHTGGTLYTFNYTLYGSNRLLTSITNAYNDSITITRNSTGKVQNICDPDNNCYTVTLDNNHNLKTLSNPSGDVITYTYNTDGLITKKETSNNGTYTYTYDDSLALTQAGNAANRTVTFSRTGDNADFTVTKVKTIDASINVTTTYRAQNHPDGSQDITVTHPNGATSSQARGADGIVETTQADGTKTIVQYAPDPRWGMQTPYVQHITKTTSGDVVFYTLHATRTATLTQTGNPLSLQTLTDTATINGLTTTRIYHSATRTWVATEPSGRVVTTTLNTVGQVSKAEASDVATLDYTYDSRGRLTNVTEGAGTSQTRVITMTYQSGTGFLASVTDALGNVTSYGYDDSGRVLTQTLPSSHQLLFSYNQGNLVSSTDVRGIDTTYEYDSHSRLTATIFDDVTGGKQTRTEYTYDKQSNVIKTVVDAGTGRLNSTTLYTYTPLFASGNQFGLKEIQDPLGNVTVYTYTTVGKLQKVDVPGPNGRHLTQYAYTNEGWLDTVTSPGNKQMNYNYDSEGRLESLVDPRGVTSRYIYESDAEGGRLKQVLVGTADIGSSSALSLTTVYTYQANSNFLAQIADPLGHTINFTYDQFGRQTEVSDHLGNKDVVAYDALDRVVQQVTGANAPTTALTATTSYDNLGRVTQRVMDPANLALTTIYTYSHPGNSDTWSLGQVRDANGTVTQYQYNSFGQVYTLTDANNQDWTYLYNNLGWLTSLRDPLYSLSPNRETTYTYDALGRPLTLSRNGDTESTAYHPDGNVYTTTDFAGYVMTYTYNNDGWLTEIEYDDSHPVPVDDVTFTYDNGGNVTAAEDGLATTSYTYDAANRLTTRTRGGKTITYTYNANSQITDIAYWGNSSVAYAYDNGNRLSSITPWGVSEDIDYTWQANGLLDSVARGTSDYLTSDYTYDSAGRLTGILHDYNTSPLARINYPSLDNVGNILTMSENDGTNIFTTTYTYDNLYRLDTVDYPSLTAISGPAADTDEFDYDAVGNLTDIDKAGPRPAPAPELDDTTIYLPLILRD